MDTKKIKYNAAAWQRSDITQEDFAGLVEFWQESHGLHVDGLCGPFTLDSIRREVEGSDIGASALSVAVASIGRGEEGRNNRGLFVDALFLENEPKGVSWCAAFVCWCVERAAEELEVEVPFVRSLGAKELFKNVIASGEEIVAKSNLKPGDVVCWDRGKRGDWMGHIGFVESYDPNTDILKTVEGNVGRFPSVVRRFEHDLSRDGRIEGFARI